MAKKQINLPSISRIAPSSVAFLEIPLGATYETLAFSMSGTGLAATMVDSIKLIANGQELQTYLNLQQLIDINQYHGRAVDTAAEWCMYFKNDDYASLSEKAMEGLGTDGLQSLVIEIALNATWPANGTIVCNGFIDTTRQPLGVYNLIRQTQMSSVAAGDIDYDKLQRNGAIYKQIHFFKSDINKIVLEADGVKIIEATKAQLERGQRNVKPFARIPVSAKASHLDFCLSGFFGDLLRTEGMNDLRARLTLGSAGVVQVVTEQLDAFKG